MRRALLSLVCPGGAAGRLSVLIFHRVLPEPDPLFPGEVHAASFDRLMRTVAGSFRVLPLSEAVDRLRDGLLPPRAAAITFDDGYADNLAVALPILQRYALPATVFVTTGFLDGGIMFNDVVTEAFRRTRREAIDVSALGLGVVAAGSTEQRRAAIEAVIPRLKYLPITERMNAALALARQAGVELPRDLMLTTAELQLLARSGIAIGAHTVHHPILTTLPLAAARSELSDSRIRLESILQRPVELFAYPNGTAGEDFAGEHARLARDTGFKAAFTTEWGAAARASDPYALPRFTPWDREPWRFVARLVRYRLKPVAAA